MSQAVGTEEVPWRSPPLASGAQISDIENSSGKRLAPKFAAFGARRPIFLARDRALHR
jgi:hypothetical protein